MSVVRPEEVIKYIRLMPGMKVADLGAGSGEYTRILLDRVGHEGRVYAVDGLPPVVEARAREARASGRMCHGLVCQLEEPLPFATNLLDAAVLANTLHGVDPFARVAFVAELARVVKPKGQILVVDWAGSFRNMGPPASMLAAPKDTVQLFSGAGFKTGDMLPAGTHHYAFVATLLV